MTAPRRIRNLIQADSVHPSASHSEHKPWSAEAGDRQQLYKYNELSAEHLNQLGMKSSRIVSVGCVQL